MGPLRSASYSGCALGRQLLPSVQLAYGMCPCSELLCVCVCVCVCVCACVCVCERERVYLSIMLDPLLQVRGDPENVFDLVRTEVFEREKAAVLQGHRTLSGRADAGDTTPTQS